MYINFVAVCIQKLEQDLVPKQKELDSLAKEQEILRARLENLTSKTYRESKEMMARLRHGGISPTSSESAASSSSFLSQSPSPSNCSGKCISDVAYIYIYNSSSLYMMCFAVHIIELMEWWNAIMY